MKIIDCGIIESEDKKEDTFFIYLKFFDGKVLLANLPKTKREKAELELEQIDEKDEKGSDKFIDWLKLNGITENKRNGNMPKLIPIENIGKNILRN